MKYIGISIKDKDSDWHFIERNIDGRTAEDGKMKEMDFALRVITAEKINWNSAFIWDGP